MEPRINEALNLVLPIGWNEKDEPVLWAYHTPISREVFETNWRVIAAVQAEIGGKGEMGQRIARLALRDAVRQNAAAQGLDPDKAPQPLLAEIKRLTIILAPGEAGYEEVPVDFAIGRTIISQEDWLEVESALVFFTCALALVARKAKTAIAELYAKAVQGSITSLLPSAFVASLVGSTTAETSEQIPAQAPVPQ